LYDKDSFSVFCRLIGGSTLTRLLSDQYARYRIREYAEQTAVAPCLPLRLFIADALHSLCALERHNIQYIIAVDTDAGTRLHLFPAVAAVAHKRFIVDRMLRRKGVNDILCLRRLRVLILSVIHVTHSCSV